MRSRATAAAAIAAGSPYQFARLSVSYVDVTPRRLQNFRPSSGKVRWTFGDMGGVVAKDGRLGIFTVPHIPVTQVPTVLRMVAAPADTPER